MLSEETKGKTWSILMSSQDTTLLLYPVMGSVEIQFQLIQTFPNKSQ